MATFKERVQQLVGTSTVDANLTEYLTATASELLQIMPETDLIRYAEESEIQNANGFDTKNKRVLGLVRDGYSAQEVPLGLKTQISDANSIHYSAKRTPVYYYDGGTVFVKPDPTATEKVQFKYVSYPTVAHGDSSVTGYPETAEYPIVLGACVKHLAQSMADAVDNEDMEIAQGVKLQMDTINGLYQQEIQRLSGLK